MAPRQLPAKFCPEHPNKVRMAVIVMTIRALNWGIT